MFYELKEALHLNGKDEYLDISGKLHHFLQSETIGLRARFRTEASGYGTLLGIYYKESLFPDFSVNIHKGCLSISTKVDGKLCILTDDRAVNDGREHSLVISGDGEGIRAFLDGRLALWEKAAAPYCQYGYVGFATIGRGTLENQYAGFFEGDLLEFQLSREPFPEPEGVCVSRNYGAGEDPYAPLGGFAPARLPLFQKGMAGVENYRIPTLLTTPSGTVIACADARTDAPGDNPNHIARAVRISGDSGNTWEDISFPVDFGGCGREDGAAAIDGQLALDDATGTVFMLYGHTKAGIGSALSLPGTGFDDEGLRLLHGKDGKLYRQQPDGTVTGEDGNPSGYRVDAYDRLYRGQEAAGSVCHGEEAPFQICGTSFLQIIESHDGGRTWSEPRDLNPQVKKEWMCFLGPGPGIGICMKEGAFAGRLVCPVYFSNPSGVYTCAAIWSDDHGKTWEMGASVNDGRELDGVRLSGEHTEDPRALTGECQLTELPGGVLKFFIRNPHYGHVVTAVSRDGGAGWTGFTVEDQLVNPDCQFSILRAGQGDENLYLYSGPEHRSLRAKGVIRISQDDTAGWETKRLIEPGEFGYSCLTVLPDGQIGLLYEGLDLTLYFMKFPFCWVQEEKRRGE